MNSVYMKSSISPIYVDFQEFLLAFLQKTILFQKERRKKTNRSQWIKKNNGINQNFREIILT
jgi:hypothetical protein